MTEYDISLTKDQVEGLLTNDEGLKGLVTVVVNQIMEEQMSEQLAARAATIQFNCWHDQCCESGYCSGVNSGTSCCSP